LAINPILIRTGFLDGFHMDNQQEPRLKMIGLMIRIRLQAIFE